MTGLDTSTHDEANRKDDKPTKPRRRLVIAGSAIAIVTALIAGTALAFGHGGGWHHGWGGPMAAGEMADHIEQHVKHVLSDINTTDEQEAQIISIIQAAARDVHDMHEGHAAGREQLREILSAASVDRARLETLRADHLRLADEASQRMLTALADAADLLTPEQRSELARKMEERHHRRRGDEK